MQPEIELILNEMRAGFKSIWDKLDEQQKEYIAHVQGCMRRFSELETYNAVQEAKSTEANKYNYWPTIFKAAITFITGSALVLIYKIALTY